MLAQARTNWVILKTCLEERFVYRADFAFATLVRFLPIVTQIFLWGAIYSGASTGDNPDKATTLNSYTYHQMIAYYLLVMLARAFSSMPGLAGGIARDVRDGTIKKYLTQPIDMLGYLFWHRIAHKLVYYVIATGPFALVFYLCRDYFPIGLNAATLLALVLSLMMGFLIGFLIESLIGLISFWFLEVSSLLFIFNMLNYFLSGHMIPLDWLGNVGQWVEFLPFRFLAYVPAAIALGKPGYVLGGGLERMLLIEMAWIVGLLILNRITFARGVRRYGAFGG
ncbi:MAG: ABC-2 family transporter protein [Planctomycetota bacterium]|nr:ABC-2 family transporter protein [Planctomycetota bacterium]